MTNETSSLVLEKLVILADDPDGDPGAAEVALPLFTSVLPPKTFAVASMLTGIAAAVARTIQQKSMHPDDEAK